jgi:hypothetical protein
MPVPQSSLLEEVRQLGDIHRNPPRLGRMDAGAYTKKRRSIPKPRRHSDQRNNDAHAGETKHDAVGIELG